MSAAGPKKEPDLSSLDLYDLSRSMDKLSNEIEDLVGAPPVRVPSSYTVNVYDRAGLYHEAGGCNWQTALVLYDSLRKQFPDKQVRVINLDRAENDWDGLTDDERDALERQP